MTCSARFLWQLIEPLHAVVYFAPETNQEAARLGLVGRGMGYVAFRAAPLGRVGAGAVTALFYGFHPDLLAGAVPAAWDGADPQQVLAARLAAVDGALLRLLPTQVHAPEVARAAALLSGAVAGADVSGRALAAANKELPWPAEPHLALWQAVTTLREHRGDGHVAALVAAEVGPCEAHVLRSAAGAVPSGLLLATRGWSGREWAEAADRLRGRGWLSASGELTDIGRQERAAYEQRTDELAAGPWRALGPERTDELAGLLQPLAAALVDAGGVPVGGGLGSPWPPG